MKRPVAVVFWGAALALYVAVGWFAMRGPVERADRAAARARAQLEARR